MNLNQELLGNWKDCRYFLENFGISRGRLISRYPKHWKRLVYESLNGVGDVERKRIVEALARLGSQLLARHNDWNDDQDWLTNAEAEHQRRPFRAIIAAANPRLNANVLVSDEINEEEALWAQETQRYIARTASSMAAEVASLLQTGRQLIFIDPHFGPEKAGHRKPLQAFLAAALQGRTVALSRIEYHTKHKYDYDDFCRQCSANNISKLIPHGLNLHIKRWRERVGRDMLHDRFILTDLGGVKFSVGLDQGRAGQETHVYILSKASYRSAWHKYLADTPAFELVDEVIVEGQRR